MSELTATRVAVRCVPLHDRVLLCPAEEKKMSDGGVHLPDTIQERETPKEGVVLAVGPGKWENGARTPMQVVVGDTVRYSPNAGSDFRVGDDLYLILHERDVYAVLYKDE